MLTVDDVQAVRVLVEGEERHVARALWDRLAGPLPPAAFVSNGCGPKMAGWAGRALAWTVPDSLHGWPLWIACHVHDWHYYYGARPLGWGSAARRRADGLLAENLIVVMSAAGVVSAPRIFAVALLYWLGVRLGGWAAWRHLPHQDGAKTTPTRRAVRTAAEAPWAAVRLAARSVGLRREEVR